MTEGIYSRRQIVSPPRDVLRVWWLGAVTVAGIGYVVASQALISLEGWSRLGLWLAALLMLLLLFGCLLGICRLDLGPWVWLSVVFVCYCVARGVPKAGGDWPLDALFPLITAFLGGVGVGLALQQGMPFRAVAAAQVASSLYSAGFFGSGSEPASGGAEGRYAGLVGNANELGLQLALGACLIWFLPKNAGWVACAFAPAAVAYALLVTGCRKVVLIVPIFLVMVLIQAWAGMRRHRTLLVFIGGVALCLACAIVPSTTLEGAKGITAIQRSVDYEDSSFDLRAGMTRQAVRLWLSAPLLGSGTDSFRRISGYEAYAHDNYAELLCDTGLVGVLLFYGIHAYILLKSFRLARPLQLYCGIFVLLLLMLDVGYVSYNSKQAVMILMVLASAVAGSRQTRQTMPGRALMRGPTAPLAA